MSKIVVFGDGSLKNESHDYISAFDFSKKLAEKGFDIVSGGYAGIMEAVSKGTEGTDANCIGVTTDYYKDKIPNKYIKEEIRMSSYMDRTNKLIEIGDIFVVFPGGTGTLLELAALWALKERNELGNRIIITIGEQWTQLKQIMAFYSEKIIDQYDLIKNVDSVDSAYDLIVKYFEKD